MSHYRSNLRDLEFNLFEVFGDDTRMGVGPFAEMDAESARGVLTELEKVASGPLAASYVDADRNPPTFDPATHSVKVPESFKKSYQAMLDGDWFRMEAPASVGGFGAPPSLRWAAAELILGANPAIFMYSSGPGMTNVLRPARHRGAARLRPDPAGPALGHDHGAHRARCRQRRRRRPDQGRSCRPMAAGTWRA